MAGQTPILLKTYKMSDPDGVAMYTAVTYGAKEGYCAKPTVDNAVPLGVVDEDQVINNTIHQYGDLTDKDIDVTIEGIVAVKLSGAINYGDRVILGAGGVVKAVPSASGTYNILGFAEKAGVDGDVIYVRIANHVITK
jgi:hypothetical protein